MTQCDHVLVTAEVTDAPEGFKKQIGLILTICSMCGWIAGVER